MFFAFFLQIFVLMIVRTWEITITQIIHSVKIVIKQKRNILNMFCQ